jgi:vacuolar-type H+-ATPase catalytic subunit A/Vma1
VLYVHEGAVDGLVMWEWTLKAADVLGRRSNQLGEMVAKDGCNVRLPELSARLARARRSAYMSVESDIAHGRCHGCRLDPVGPQL